MASQNTPIKVNLAGTGVRYIFYKDSAILTQLTYYPYVQFAVIGVFPVHCLPAFQLCQADRNKTRFGWEWQRRLPTS